MAPTKALQIRIGRMRADAHVMRYSQLDATRHDQRIAGMETAGEVGLIDQRHGQRIVAHAPGAEALAHVAVEKNAVHEGSLKPARVTPKPWRKNEGDPVKK